MPKIEKVVVNCGIGPFAKDKNAKPQAVKDLSLITGQKPIFTKARKSIAGFKIRQGQEIGLKTTLRGKRMQDFISRLINIALPRTRDFHGIPQESIDTQGNLTIGIKEHTVFPEINPEDVQRNFGFEIIIVTTAKTREDAIKLFSKLKFPIK